MTARPFGPDIVGGHRPALQYGRLIMERRLQDIIPTRREVLKWGGVALAGTWIEHVVWPLQVRAAGKVNPRGTARNCIMIELGGAINQAACWDFKEMKWTPKDLKP